MPTQKLNVNGIGIQVEDHGGANRAVLFLHFSGSNLRMWDPVIPFFGQDYRCITLDLRAHGRSDAPEAGYHIEDMAKDVAGALSQLEAAPAHVVGSSLGAEVGLALAAAHPALVRSLVAEGALASEYGPYGIQAAASLSEDEARLARLEEGRAKPEQRFDTREAAGQALSAFYRQYDFWNPYVEAMVEYGVVEDRQGTFVSAWRRRAQDAYMDNYFALRVEDYYKDLACPVMMLPDEDDAADPQLLDIMTRLSQLAQQCEIRPVPDVMLPFGWMLTPEPLAQAGLTFLAKVDEPAGR